MKKVIVLGISSLILLGCNNSPKKSTAAAETKTHATHSNVAAIELNNGEKWLVNEEMKPFALKGAELVNVFVQEKKTDFKELARLLKDQNNQLVESCTMDGKSHDELHKWLLPHLELVKELEYETDAIKANEIVSRLQNSYQQYHQYFN